MGREWKRSCRARPPAKADRPRRASRSVSLRRRPRGPVASRLRRRVAAATRANPIGMLTHAVDAAAVLGGSARRLHAVEHLALDVFDAGRYRRIPPNVLQRVFRKAFRELRLEFR